MSRIFIEGIDCSGKTTYVNDLKNHPSHVRLYPKHYKKENKSWEMVWLELSKCEIFNRENVLIDRSFISIYVYSELQIDLFVKFVDVHNLLKINDEIKLLDIDYSTYLKNARKKIEVKRNSFLKKPIDRFDHLSVREFLHYKRKYWEILTHPYFIKNFCLGFYQNDFDLIQYGSDSINGINEFLTDLV